MKKGVNSNKFVFCIAVAIVLSVSLIAFAHAAQNSGEGFSFWDWVKGFFGKGKITGNVIVDPACGSDVSDDVLLTADMACSGDAIVIPDAVAGLGSKIVIDCQGRSITYTGSNMNSDTKGISIGRFNDNVTIKNCKINNYFYGVYGHDTDYDTIMDSNISNSRYPIYIDSYTEGEPDGYNSIISNSLGCRNSPDGASVYLAGRSIDHSSIINNKMDGICSGIVSDTRIETEFGVQQLSVYNYNISRNVINSGSWAYSTLYGMKLIDGANSEISYNIINHVGGIGIEINAGLWNNNVNIIGNVIHNAKGGPAMYLDGLGNSLVANNTINDFYVADAPQFGVQGLDTTVSAVVLGEGFDSSDVVGNTITNCTNANGFIVYGVLNEFKNNSVHGCLKGVDIHEFGNYFTYNNFTFNKQWGFHIWEGAASDTPGEGEWPQYNEGIGDRICNMYLDTTNLAGEGKPVVYGGACGYAGDSMNPPIVNGSGFILTPGSYSESVPGTDQYSEIIICSLHDVTLSGITINNGATKSGGIQALYGYGDSFIGNNITNAYTGIEARMSMRVNVKNNVLSNNRVRGLEISSAPLWPDLDWNYKEISGNKIENNGYDGIWIGPQSQSGGELGGDYREVTNYNINNNLIRNNGQVGITLGYRGGIIDNNYLDGNARGGIYVDDYVNVTNNKIYNTGYGESGYAYYHDLGNAISTVAGYNYIAEWVYDMNTHGDMIPVIGYNVFKGNTIVNTKNVAIYADTKEVQVEGNTISNAKLGVYHSSYDDDVKCLNGDPYHPEWFDCIFKEIEAGTTIYGITKYQDSTNNSDWEGNSIVGNYINNTRDAGIIAQGYGKRIDNNKIYNSTYIGPGVGGSYHTAGIASQASFVKIVDNKVEHAFTGISSSGGVGRSVSIIDNVVNDTYLIWNSSVTESTGIYVGELDTGGLGDTYGWDNLIVRGNKVSHTYGSCLYSIGDFSLLPNSSNQIVVIESNTMEDCGWGPVRDSSPGWTYTPISGAVLQGYHHNFKNNRIENVGGDGLVLKGGFGLIEGNYIKGAGGVGLLLKPMYSSWRVTNNTIRNNQVHDSGVYSVSVEGVDNNNNKFYNNLFNRTCGNVDDKNSYNKWEFDNVYCYECVNADTNEKVLSYGSCATHDQFGNCADATNHITCTGVKNVVGGNCIGGNYWFDYGGDSGMGGIGVESYNGTKFGWIAHGADYKPYYNSAYVPLGAINATAVTQEVVSEEDAQFSFSASVKCDDGYCGEVIATLDPETMACICAPGEMCEYNPQSCTQYTSQDPCEMYGGRNGCYWGVAGSADSCHCDNIGPCQNMPGYCEAKGSMACDSAWWQGCYWGGGTTPQGICACSYTPGMYCTLYDPQVCQSMQIGECNNQGANLGCYWEESGIPPVPGECACIGRICESNPSNPAYCDAFTSRDSCNNAWCTNGCSWQEGTIPVSHKNGTIPMNSGNPFYTTTQNPFSCGVMSDGDICTPSWNVVTTTNLTSAWEFFVTFDTKYGCIAPVDSPARVVTVTGGEPQSCPECTYDEHCNDGLYCTVDDCVVGGTCTHSPVNSMCDDGNLCTTDSCDLTWGCVYEAVSVNDGNTCTIDSCNQATGEIVHTANDAYCDDGLWCNGESACDTALGCVDAAGGAPNCDDGDQCTIDWCNEGENVADSVGWCEHTFDNSNPVCECTTNAECDDGNVCTVDTCDVATYTCLNTPDDSKTCNDGFWCTVNDRCDSGDCIGDERAVDDGVACTSEYCDESADDVVITIHDDLCDDGLWCNGAESCDATLGCQGGTGPLVSDSIECTVDQCDEASDLIIHTPDNSVCQDGLWCNGAEVCLEGAGCQDGTAPVCNDELSCTQDACSEGNDNTDNFGSCTADPALCQCTTNADCDDSNPCTDDVCNMNSYTCSNVADDTNICNDGFFCTVDDRCDAGSCVADSMPVNDNIDCTADSCDEVTDQVLHMPDNSVCDDSLYCNGAEVCDVQLGCQAGVSPSTDDGVACTVDDCDETSDSISHSADDSLCQDGLWCNGAETCDASLGCQSGSAPNCDDSLECTIDSCDEGEYASDNVGSCVYDPTVCECRTNNDCNDNNPCTDDVCDLDTYSCSNDADNSNSCNDGFFCTVDDRCEAGSCVADPIPVDDDVGCTIDSCDEESDRILHLADDSVCNDGLYCNGEESCSIALGCQDGADPATDDGVACTVDSCDEDNNAIVHAADNSFCQDGLWCNGIESCDVSLGCQSGAAQACGDGIACTVDSCDEGMLGDNAGTCEHGTQACQCTTDLQCNDGNPCTDDVCDLNSYTCANNANDMNVCSDDLFCTINDRCDAGSCVADSRPIDDSIGCTVDSCDEVNDQVLHLADDSVCNDNLYCNGQESCSPALGCEDGAAPIVDDGIGCTTDRCDESSDSIAHLPVDSACDDGLWCNGDESCSPVLDCQGGTERSTNDGVACTIDSCDEVADEIVHVTDDSFCQDGLWCNGEESCDARDDCQAGTSESCGDGIACTLDVCDEGTDLADNAGTCEHATDACACTTNAQCNDNNPCTDDVCDMNSYTCLNNANDMNSCSDGLFCTVNDRCESGSCVADSRVVDDGVSCTTDGCDEESDKVLNLADDLVCNDGLYCNGVEVCDPTLDCQAGVAPATDDAVACTVDICDESSDSISHTPDNSFCQDGLWCNGIESCDIEDGCQSGQAPDCKDGVGCTTDSCDEGVDLGDNTGSCSYDTASCECKTDADCVDDNPCTDDICTTQLTCVHLNDDENTCDDGFFCTTDDRCSSGDCVSDPRLVDDGIVCTLDSCDEELDSVLHLPDDSVCSDSLYCNGEEVCSSELGCLGGVAPSTDDNVACTVDQCDEQSDTLTHSPDNSLCQDGLWCNGAETCDVLLGCQDGAAPSCADAISCTIDSCFEGTDASDNEGTCEHSTESCQCTTNAQCNDNNPCTDDVCGSDNTCVNTADDTNVCNDGFFCTINDKCEAGSCVADSRAVDDGISCTIDSCDEDSDQVLHLADDSVCNDGLYCNGAEVCQPGAGCQGGTTPDCGDGLDCTVDSCDEIADSCSHISIDEDADGYSTCDGPDQDCNDYAASINPGAYEECNAIDDNCNGWIDEGYDKDGDGYTVCNGDCDDTSSSVNPGNPEVCDGVDNDCDGKIDFVSNIGDLDDSCGADGCDGTDTYFDHYCDEGTGCAVISNTQDDDGDGYNGLCSDCNDANAEINPGEEEICPDDGIDNNCDGEATYDCEAICDVDGDGYNDADKWWCLGSDCDDTNADIHPNADEVCDGKDSDCDGIIDNRDMDADGINDCTDDWCLNTELDSLIRLNPNHHAVLDWDIFFETNIEAVGKAASKVVIVDGPYLLRDTHGCSCEQILLCKPGENNGEEKFGCSPGTMHVWNTTIGWGRECVAVVNSTNVVVSGMAKPQDTDTDLDGKKDTADKDDDNDGILDADDSEPESRLNNGYLDWWCRLYPSKCPKY